MPIDLGKILPFPPNPVQITAGGIQLPKLSELVKPFADIESQVQESISAATGVTPPPGPATTLLTIAEMVESGQAGVPMPGAGTSAGSSKSTQAAGAQVVTVEVPAEPISESRIESMETQSSEEEVPGTPVPRIY